ncbi:hypothetical protein HC248_01245 [Polaromonas vacuolata]|uniref:Uncharacterized protein n=1 Tax=Polaromonas vacuolata TaxID=37448 RepID=A0A6H2H7W1_9BURK|nr:hypothetical protein HC248_01245 [Polaromonas vacuolata]
MGVKESLVTDDSARAAHLAPLKGFENRLNKILRSDFKAERRRTVLVSVTTVKQECA